SPGQFGDRGALRADGMHVTRDDPERGSTAPNGRKKRERQLANEGIRDSGDLDELSKRPGFGQVFRDGGHEDDGRVLGWIRERDIRLLKVHIR
ncbi:14995_t:CDS:2, partial [Acaulospora colombiana]